MLSGAVVAGALVCAGVAAAGHWKVSATKAGTAAAKATVVHQSDVGSGWKGSGAKPDLLSQLCTGSRAKLPVVPAIGAARIVWENAHALIRITSQSVVLGSAQAVATDWKHSVLPAGVLACTKKKVERQLPKSEKLVSLGWEKFPKVGSHSKEARAIVTLKGVKVIADFLVIGAGKNELTLTFTQPALLARNLQALELKLAKKLVGRA